MSRIRNTVNGIDSRLGQAEQVREFKGIAIKLSKMKHTERKDGKKINRASVFCLKWPNIYI